MHFTCMNATQVSVKKLRKLSGELQRLAAEVDRLARIQIPCLVNTCRRLIRSSINVATDMQLRS